MTALIDMTPEQRQRWARINADTRMVGESRHAARRIPREGRTIVVPPEGHGNVWSGGAR